MHDPLSIFFFLSILLPYKLFLCFFFRNCHVWIYKMVWSVQKGRLETMSDVCVCVCMCVPIKIEKSCKMESCTLLPHYFPSFTKPPLWVSMLIKFNFLLEEAFWMIENNKQAMCKVLFCMPFISLSIDVFILYISQTQVDRVHTYLKISPESHWHIAPLQRPFLKVHREEKFDVLKQGSKFRCRWTVRCECNAMVIRLFVTRWQKALFALKIK